jgi:hypothetical protein
MEGIIWHVFDFEEPELSINLEGQKDSTGNYLSPVKVTINASDNDEVYVQYSMGDEYIDYSAPFEISKDCVLKVRAFDNAENMVEKNEEIKFVSLIGDISFKGDYEYFMDNIITDNASIKVEGNLLVSDNNVITKINGEKVKTKSDGFSKVVKLENGKNTINVEVELYGMTSSINKTVYRTYNPIVNSIKDEDVVSDSLLKLEGNVCPGSQIEINGQSVSADLEGNFDADINLTEGKNTIIIKSCIGNYTNETEINVYYYSRVNISITNLVDKQVVKSETVIVEGCVDIPCTVRVDDEKVKLDSDNKFTKEVELKKGINVINIEVEYNEVKSNKTIKINYVDPDDNYVVYINWDGFAKYYYDEARREGIVPVLDSIIEEGVIFNNAYTGIPSITNAMQPAIVSGTYSQGTGNCYRYYDRDNNIVVQFSRENNAETIAEAAVRQGLKVASVHQFALQDRGTTIGDYDKPYIQMPDPADYAVRFDAAIKLIKGEEVGSGVSKIELDEIPRFIALYMDDLDGIGHNEHDTYGVSMAATEQERIENVKLRLSEMDSKLGEFIEVCKEIGIYDNMSFILTTDHGMSPFGQQNAEEDEYGYSKLSDLVSILESLGYKVEVLLSGESAEDDTDIVLVTVGLQAQLTFTDTFTENDIQNIINAVSSKEYVGTVMQKDEIIERGTMADFADIIISPKPPYSFKKNITKLYNTRGQHDSLDETSQKIFSVMWGKDIKKGYEYKQIIHNIDFARTMAELLGINGPQEADGNLLYDAMVN